MTSSLKLMTSSLMTSPIIRNDITAHMCTCVCVCVCVYVCMRAPLIAQCTPCRLTYGDISKNTATSWSSGSHSTHPHCTASDSFKRALDYQSVGTADKELRTRNKTLTTPMYANGVSFRGPCGSQRLCRL